MKQVPVSIVQGASVDLDNDTTQAQPFIADFGMGAIHIIPATSFDCGDMLRDDGSKVGAIFLSHGPSQIGLSYLFSACDLRELARRLNETAAILESEAATIASAAIEKARGR